MNGFLLSKSCVNLMEVHMGKVFLEVLVDYTLMDKVRIFF